MYNANGIQKLYCTLKLNPLFAAAALNIISLEMKQSLVSLAYSCININSSK